MIFKNYTSVKNLNQDSNSESDSSGLESHHCRHCLGRGWVRGEKRKSGHTGCRGFESLPRVDKKYRTHGYLIEALDYGTKNQI